MTLERPPHRTRVITPLALAALVVLVLLRLPHLVGPVDDPHAWRQLDTVFCSWDYWRHGIDLLHPHVSWLGGHRTLIFELPLPEAMAAGLDRLFGFTPTWDRVIALAFTVLSTAWLYALARELADDTVASLAAILYLVAPLAQFFSRAAQVDFAAQAFAHGLLYHAIRASRRGGAGHVGVASLCAVLAAMIKGPYLIPVLGPLALVALGAGVPGLLATGLPLAAGAVAFVLWRRHVNVVNGGAPDWNFLPGYYKELNPWWWYIGNVHQRLEVGNWIKLARRILYEISTPIGIVLAACSLLWRDTTAGRRPNALPVALAWLAFTFLYMLVFFPLNVIHNYYQIPFLAPLALLAALGLAALTRPAVAPLVRRLAWAAFGGLVVLSLLLPAHLHYYRVDDIREAAARAITAHVPEGDLVIAVDHASVYSDPRLLGRARRCGWAVDAGDLTPALLEKLRPFGPRWVAWVSEPGVAKLAPPAFLASREVASERLLGPLPDRPGHVPDVLGTLYLYRLGDAGAVTR